MNRNLQQYETFPSWKQFLYSALNYLIALFVTLGSMSIFNQSIEREYHILPICAVLVGLHLVLFPNLFAWKHLKKLLIFSVIWCTYLAVYALVEPYDTASLIKKFVIMFLLLVYYFYSQDISGNREKVLRCYTNVIFVIALISLFLWFTASVLHWFHSTGPILIDWGSERKAWGFYNLYFHWQNDFFIHGHRFFRNIGIFTEAPMYSLHLCIALMIDALLNHSASSFRWFRMIILSLTVATTFSITGYLLVAALWVYVIYDLIFALLRSDDEAKKKKGKVLVIAVTILGVLLAIAGFLLVKDKLASRSGGSRMEDYKIGFKAWRDSVLFGYGYNNQDARLQYASWRRLHRAENGYTNSPMAILCEGGIWLFTAYFLPMVYGIVTSIEQRNWKRLVFMVLFVYLFIVTIFNHSILMVAFLALWYADFLNKGYRKPQTGGSV